MSTHGTLLQFDFNPVHSRENNIDSEAFLEQNRHRFNGNCWELLLGMLKGTQYSTNGYNKVHKISSLPRRVMDLQKVFGLGDLIKYEWAPEGSEDEGYKQCYIAEEDRPQVMQLLIEKLEIKKAS